MCSMTECSNLSIRIITASSLKVKKSDSIESEQQPIVLSSLSLKRNCDTLQFESLLGIYVYVLVEFLGILRTIRTINQCMQVVKTPFCSETIHICCIILV